MAKSDRMQELFQARGMKLTPQRQRILEVLAESEGHPTAEAVCSTVREKMPTVSLKTVYQTLHDLYEFGGVLQLDLGTGSTRFDPNTSGSHHHLVCDICGNISDVELRESAEELVGVSVGGFKVERVEIVLRGRCTNCQDLVGERVPGAKAHLSAGS